MAKETHPLQIFRTGRHTAMSGATLAFSATDLAASAAAYDPAKHEAPIVVGHPATDAPAYGWVRSLVYANDGLEAEPCQVDPDFAEMVGAGRFKKISAAFYAPESPSNPVPGVYYLRHVGFLGAQAPAVKGLRGPSFAADEAGIVVFADWDDVTNAGLWRSLRDWMIGKFGLDVAEQAIPSDQVQSLEIAAAQEDDDAQCAPDSTTPSFKEMTHVTPEQAAALAAENAQLKNDLEAASAALRAEKLAKTRAGVELFAESMIGEGRLLPAQKDVAVATLLHLETQETPVEFGEGDARKPLAEAFKALLSSISPQIAFTEVATRNRQNKVDLSDPMALARAAQEFQESEAAAGRSISIAQAVSTLLNR